jgi:DNA-binding NtrC family response regulator
MNPGYILIVDDEPEIRRVVHDILEDEHYRVATADSAEQAREVYGKERPDLVLLDIWMPGTDGISLLKEWSKAGRLDAPVVMMSGHGTVEAALEATRLGAYDFIEKPVSMGKLLVTVERALENERLRRENSRLRKTSDPAGFLVGKSSTMRALREQIERVAPTDTWVLITGEPGCGKASAARYLHDQSPRRDAPCIEIGIASGLMHNLALRFFGEERDGNAVAGAIEQATAGSLILNEVGELDLSLQGLLLGAIQEMAFTRNDGRARVPINTRFISVSGSDLQQRVIDGRFRKELFYRLNVVVLPLPPLRDHREDVPDLVNFYADWIIDIDQLPYRKFATGALNALRNYAWPGNIRELKNMVQRLLILNTGPEITVADVQQALGGPPTSVIKSQPHTLFDLPLRDARDEFERAYLEHHLQQMGGNVAEVARISEMERTHLYRKLKNLGINVKNVAPDKPGPKD